MEVRMKYKDGKANVMIVNEPEDNGEMAVGLSTCLDELYKLVTSIQREEMKED